MMRYVWLAVLLTAICPAGARPQDAAGSDPARRITEISEKILHAFARLGEVSCEVEAQYFREGKEDKKYCFTWFQEKEGVTRVTFSRPFPGLSASYKSGDRHVTVKPFPYLSFIKFKLSLYHPLLRTPSGQRMDQTSLEYLSRFFYANVHLIQRHQSAFSEGSEKVALSFWAANYTGGTDLNRYYVTVSKDNHFPLRIERHNTGGDPIEVIVFTDFVVHHGKDKRRTEK